MTLGCISKADERPVKFDKIPVAAQNFIKTNFADNAVVHVTKDDDFVAPDYEVVLDNGTVVHFSNSGSLEKIEATFTLIYISLTSKYLPKTGLFICLFIAQINISCTISH